MPEPGKVAIPRGAPKLAAAPMPLLAVPLPPPASVLTSPEVANTVLMRLFCWSATKTAPEASAAMPVGPLKEAKAPWPLAKPATPLPARVLTFHTQRSALSPATARGRGIAPPPVKPSKRSAARKSRERERGFVRGGAKEVRAYIPCRFDGFADSLKPKKKTKKKRGKL